MEKKEYICVVKNRSSSNVNYEIPSLMIKRRFRPGEVKEIPYSELAKLTYEPGGRNIMDKYLYIAEKEITDSLGVKRELEYDWDEARIRQLLTTDSLDQFLDCLDYAPIGVIDIIKTLSVELPLGDPRKKLALKEKTGIDVDAMYQNSVDEESLKEEVTTGRRVKPEETTTSDRRYKVVG